MSGRAVSRKGSVSSTGSRGSASRRPSTGSTGARRATPGQRGSTKALAALDQADDLIEEASSEALLKEELNVLAAKGLQQAMQIDQLATELDKLRHDHDTMEKELETARSREAQLEADLEMAGRLTEHIARLEEQLATERSTTLGIIERLKAENIGVTSDRQILRERAAMSERQLEQAAAGWDVERTKLERLLAGEQARRLELVHSYEHVAQWMVLVAGGGSAWTRGRAGDKGTVVERLTAADEQSVWSRSCAGWMQGIDVADLLRQEAVRHFEAAAAAEGCGDMASAVRSNAFMADTMDQLVTVLQRHKANLRHAFFAYCHSWPFGVSAHLATGGDAADHVTTDSDPEGGLTREEFWRLLQDIGMSYTVLTRADADLVFLRSNRALYDREAFYTAAETMMPAMGSTGGQAGMGSEQQHAASSWTRRYQALHSTLSFVQFCEAVIRLACIHVPARLSWGNTRRRGVAAAAAGVGGGQPRPLSKRLEMFLTSSIYPAVVAERGAPYSTGRAHEQLGGGGGADGGGGRKSLSLSRDRVEFKRARDKAQHAAAAQAAAEEAAAVAVESLRAAMSVGVSGGEGGEGADERGEPRDWSERASFY